MPFFPESFLYTCVILNDAVMHYDDSAGAVPVRVGVVFAWPAMGSPACVADSIAAIQRTQADRRLKIAELACGPADLHPVAGARDSYSSRVITAVFQPPKPLKNNRGCRSVSDVSNDAAHKAWLLICRVRC